MEYIADNYDVVVIGAGHAGCEAALAAARLGCRTAIITMNLDSIANMPCNPRVGGTSKGHLVREIDALGGEMGKAVDQTFIQSRMLNRSKGPAVYSLRAQVDRRQYHRVMKQTLENQENLDIKQAEIVDILVEGSSSQESSVLHTVTGDGPSGDYISEKGQSPTQVVKGVKTAAGAVYHCKCVIITTGTYLNAKIIIGECIYDGGPDGLMPAGRLTDCLQRLGIQMFRFKTGTPARLDRRTIDFSKMEEQKGDEAFYPFSFENEDIALERKDRQESCWLLYTGEDTRRIIQENLHRSPLFSGKIEGVGARYCPSIEDKFVRFPHRESHQVFVEPMGAETNEMYLQGMSSSLPEEVQTKMIRSLPGMEQVQIMRTGYAIEYDCIDATQLQLTLESKKIKGLFSAGQMNGTSGYEEAGAQGLIAGINAAACVQGKDAVILKRSDAYIGVLIDDIVTKGTMEPYRMMTSRAEHRLLLRQDNADMRLTEKGYQVGLISQKRYQSFLRKKEMIAKEMDRLRKKVVPPSQQVLEYLERRQSAKIQTGMHLSELLKRPEISYASLAEIDDAMPVLPATVQEQIEIGMKYDGYIKRQLLEVERFKKLEKRLLPDGIDYTIIKGLRLEARQKLDTIRPASIGQASRISGVSPADISVLLIYLAMLGK